MKEIVTAQADLCTEPFSAWFILHRSRTNHRKQARRVSQSNKALRTEFLELRDMVKEEIRFLKEIKAKRELTEDEERFIKRFNQLLNKLEKTLERELTVSRDMQSGD